MGSFQNLIGRNPDSPTPCRSEGEFDATNGFLLHEIRSNGKFIAHFCRASKGRNPMGCQAVPFLWFFGWVMMWLVGEPIFYLCKVALMFNRKLQDLRIFWLNLSKWDWSWLIYIYFHVVQGVQGRFRLLHAKFIRANFLNVPSISEP